MYLSAIWNFATSWSFFKVAGHKRLQRLQQRIRLPPRCKFKFDQVRSISVTNIENNLEGAALMRYDHQNWSMAQGKGEFALPAFA